jgi:predicted PurR-regulated permease PerM
MTYNGERSRQRPLFYALVLLAGYLSYLILGPFLAALAWAAMFAILFHGMQVALSKRLGPNRAALVTTLLAGILVVAPAVMLVSALAHEAPQVSGYLQDAARSAPRQIERVWGAVRARSPVALPEDPTQLLTEGARRALSFLAPHAGAVLADFFATLGGLVAMLFALFFFLRDGDTLSRRLRELLPFDERESDRLMGDTRDLVVASVGAGLLVAAAQGTIGGIAFWLLGMGAPVFWGVVMAFCSLLPVVGVTVVWVPAALWLLLSGEIGRGVILLLIGVFGISMADNVLRPLLLSGRTSVSGLVIFFGLLGGAAAFGFIGLVIGPIILVTTSSLLKMLRRPDLVDEPLTTDRMTASGRVQEPSNRSEGATMAPRSVGDLNVNRE